MPQQETISDRHRQPLSMRLTATASARLGNPVTEHLRSPSDLSRWIATTGLIDRPPPVDDALLTDARELREAIYRAARGVARGERPAAADRRCLNEWSVEARAARVLDEDGVARWQVSDTAPARSALGIVAADAIDILGGARDGTLRLCAGQQCAAVFLDTSQGRNRRWCSMGTCGNRAKRSAMRARERAGG
jgi:predicted RNA-binding Zn ribbon-like protein